MSEHPRFDLDNAIHTWRHFLKNERAVLPEDLDELEQHLRDEIAWRMASGQNEEEAYRKAVRRMGELSEIQHAYRRVFWEKLRGKRSLGDELKWRLSMAFNSARIIFRSLLSRKLYVGINLAGFIAALTVGLVVITYVVHELGVDRFHSKTERIVRTSLDTKLGLMTGMPRIGHESLADNIPGVESAAFYHAPSDFVLRTERGRFKANDIAFMNPAFFDLFDFRAVDGDAGTLLAPPNTALVSRSAAMRYFGTERPEGATFSTPDGDVITVVGLLEDRPEATRFNFDLAVSEGTLTEDNPWNLQGETYLLLTPGVDVESVGTALEALFNEQTFGWWLQDVAFQLEPLADLHLWSSADQPDSISGNARYMSIFIAVALFLALVAMINYINLATSHALKEIRHIGMHKVFGAGRGQLVAHRMVEPAFLVAVSAVVSVACALLLLPNVGALVGADLHFHAGNALRIGAAYVLLTLGLLLLSGLYPTLFATRWHVTAIFRNRVFTSLRGLSLRRALIVTQLAISSGVLVFTFALHKQLRYMSDQDLGYTAENLVSFGLKGSLQTSHRAFKEEVEQHTAIEAASLGSGAPTYAAYMLHETEDEQRVQVARYVADSDWARAAGFRMAAGRFLRPGEERKTEEMSEQSMVINEQAAKLFGIADDPIGQTLRFGTVVGVVEDFHMRSMHHGITPAIIHPYYTREGPVRMLVRLREGRETEALDFMRQRWDAVVPEYPFEAIHQEDILDRQYVSETRWKQLFDGYVIIVLLVAALGLFGLISVTTRARFREIGIRKVLGASGRHVVALVTRDTLVYMTLAFAAGSGVAFYFISRWLEGFSYRTEIGWVMFAAAFASMAVLTVISTSYTAYQAAIANPAETVRS